MKKKIAAMMIGFMMVGGMGSAFAAETATVPVKSKVEEKATIKKEAAVVKVREYNADLHIINGLRAERLQYKSQVVAKQDVILDLTLAAKDSGNDEALEAAKTIQADIKVLNQANGDLMEQFASHLSAFRTANKDNDTALAHNELSEASAVLSEVNANLKQKIELMDEVISVLE
ncbi:hypothetical protein [Paenibacillus sp. sgz500958]|uniref:hypothetical protein n=1 Tax=Paenibacillus sp. sgz500958 TaxID=3242475 RepID=UPI0036D38955